MKTKYPYLLITLIVFAFSFNMQVGYAQVGSENIKLNQLGFYPDGPKVAIITAKLIAQHFYILKANRKDTVFRGRLSGIMQSANSSTKTQIADFSKYAKSGSYVIDVPNVGTSYTFQIVGNVNHSIAVSTLKGFYYQRVSMPLEAKYAGKWARPAGHPDTKVLIHPSAASKERPAGTVISTPGGWYDAGDYNKYIVNSGISMGTLLSAYEDFPVYYAHLKTNIPESGNGIPDILNEVIYNLRWMLTMQDPHDGGVYNKCTNAAFDGMVMPGVTKLPRYVVQKGTAATLDFAAVMAQASRIVRKYPKQLPGLADSCLAASGKAWQWAIKNPSLEYNQTRINKEFQPAISTGGYGDNKLADEWFWAAAELYVTTKEKSYFEVVFKGKYNKITIPGWNNVYTLGVYSLLRHRNQLPDYTLSVTLSFKERVIRFADLLIAKVPSNAFQTVMGQTPGDFSWGSNATCANQGILLINAFLLTNDKKYVVNALSNLDYLLGRNATGYCFVTGAGSKSTMHPHHRPSVADGITDPVPGLLAGGPNPGKQDGCSYPFSEPETAYVDIAPAYASNEITINWNAPMVYLSNGIEALKQKVHFAGEK